MNGIAWKFAASGLVLGAASLTGFVDGMGVAPAAAQSQRAGNDEAGRLHERAARAVADGLLTEAVGYLEQAVALAPRDAGYRLLLADTYMKSGRFQSAETTYRDVTEIDPSQSRAGVALALMQVANGRAEAAMAQLERIERDAPAADVGLAYALAGAPQRAIELLEPAARALGATPRVRQNLALAYALGGDWQRARTVAAQDVAPDELSGRMAQWASFSHRAGSAEPVQALLGVNAVADSGQPVRIALNVPADGETRSVAFAAAEPVQVQPAYEPVTVRTASVDISAPVQNAEVIPMPTDAPVASAPVVFAQAEPVGEAIAVAAPAPVTVESAPVPVDYASAEASDWGVDEQGSVALPSQEPEEVQVPVRVRYAAAAEDLVRGDATVMRVANRTASVAAPAAVRAFAAGRLPGKRASGGEFVVQIGSFSSSENADRAWQHYQESYGLNAERPVTMTIDHNGRLMHRVAVSGFEKRADATQACRAIKARGGQCFVRNNAGDASINWAARYAGEDRA